MTKNYFEIGRIGLPENKSRWAIFPYDKSLNQMSRFPSIFDKMVDVTKNLIMWEMDEIRSIRKTRILFLSPKAGKTDIIKVLPLSADAMDHVYKSLRCAVKWQAAKLQEFVENMNARFPTKETKSE